MAPPPTPPGWSAAGRPATPRPPTLSPAPTDDEPLRAAHERLLAAAADLSRTQDRAAVVAIIVDAVRDALGFADVAVHVRLPGGRRADDPPGSGALSFERLQGHVVALGDLRGIVVVDGPDGRTLPVRARLRALRAFADLAGAALDAAARLEAARDAAVHDPLTGLANRAALMERLGPALARAHEADHVVGLLFCDLDGFKAVNDTLGHATGDAVLRAMAGRLEDAVRPGDLVARLGGDEFVVLCARLAGREAAEAIVRRLQATLRRPLVIGGRRVPVGASIGIALGSGATGPSALLREADEAMYAAKHSAGHQRRTA